jgi:hypothetical protein
MTGAADVAERLLAVRARMGAVTSRADVAAFRADALVILRAAYDRGILPLLAGRDFDVGASVEWIHGCTPSVWFSLRARPGCDPHLMRAATRLLRLGARLARARAPYAGPTVLDLLRGPRAVLAPPPTPTA